MKEQDYALNYYSERTTNALEEHKETKEAIETQKTSKKQKFLIFSSLAIAIIIVATAIILYIFAFSSSSSSEAFDGEIYCLYDIKNISNETNILGENFKQLSSLDIYINNIKINKTKKYQIGEEGENIVKFEFHENLNMDYMFQNIAELKSVHMNTTSKEGKITSMKSTFENCINFKSFIIDGLNTKTIESMSRLFYGTNLSTSHIEGLETDNVKDMSFMFAKSKVDILNISKFKTNKVINMSYMFYETPIKNLNLINCDTSKFKICLICLKIVKIYQF